MMANESLARRGIIAVRVGGMEVGILREIEQEGKRNAVANDPDSPLVLGIW